MKKRLLGFLLALVLVLGMLPVSAFAAADESFAPADEEVIVEETASAQIKYSTTLPKTVTSFKAVGHMEDETEDYVDYTWKPSWYTLAVYDSAGNEIPLDSPITWTVIHVDSALANQFTGSNWRNAYYGAVRIPLSENGLAWNLQADDIHISIAGYRVELCSFRELETDGCLEILYSVQKIKSVNVGAVWMNDGDYLAVGAAAPQTTKPSGGYACYKNGILTLKNYSYKGKGYNYDKNDESSFAIIYYENNLTVRLEGENTLTQNAGFCDHIYTGGSVTLDGTGSLTTESGYFGIRSFEKDVIINSGTVTINGYIDGSIGISSGGNILINGGNIHSACQTYGLRAFGDVIVRGGTVTAKSLGVNNTAAYAIYAEDTFTVAENLRVKASTESDGTLCEYVAADHKTYDLIVIGDVTTPAAPKVSIANVASSGKIKLSWNQVDGAESYRVYRSTIINTGYKLLKETTGTSLTNTSAEAGKQYYYYVIAVNEDGVESAKSEVATRVCDLPRPVVKASNVASTGKIKLTWDAIDGAKSYKVYRSTDGGKTYTLLKNTTGTSLTNTSVEAGTKYYYKVFALHESNSSANSAYSTVVSRTCDLPRPVVVATNVSSTGKIRLTWTKIEGAGSYKVYRSTDGGKTYSLLKTTTGTSLTNTSTTAGSKYYYKVYATHSNSAANSAYSLVVNRTCDLPAPVAKVALNSKGKPVVTWEKIDGAVKYTVYIYDANGTQIKTASTTGMKLTHSSAVKGTTYKYRVVAVSSNTAANSAKSSTVSITSK